METVQIVIDKALLVAADAAARRTKRNRSALVRDALREHLRKLDVVEKEALEREGYRKMPQTEEEMHLWDGENVWLAE